MKKICFITTISATIKSFILKTAMYLHENTDWDISFICNEDEEFAKALPEYIHYFPVKMKRGISISGFKAIREMKKIFRREKFDMIQYSTPNAALYASIAGKKAGIKVRNYHLMGLRYIGASGLIRKTLKRIEKISCKNSTDIECVSNSNLQLCIQEKLFPKEKATVVWNGSTGGVDLERFNFSKREEWRKEVRGELGLADEEFIFGFVGRITKDKGINEILSAYQKLEGKARLLFVGNLEGIDTLDPSLYEKAKENKGIIFHESVKDVERYFAAMDVLLLPSYREGFGNVIIEAAAVGTPAIVSNIPGPIDAIEEGKTAMVVPVKDSEALATAMLTCAENMPIQSQACVQFVRERFDENQLCGYILERKKRLLQIK